MFVGSLAGNKMIDENISLMQDIKDIRRRSVKNPLTCVSRGQWDNGDRCLLRASRFTHRNMKMISQSDGVTTVQSVLSTDPMS